MLGNRPREWRCDGIVPAQRASNDFEHIRPPDLTLGQKVQTGRCFIADSSSPVFARW